MTPPTHCLECNAPLSASETQGLCARCLLKLGFASQLASPSNLPASPANSGAPPMMPFTFGDYRIERLLGKGGMGAVYEAEDLTSHRRVALKALGHSLDSPETRKRFLREGRLAAAINHPNSVYVYGTEEIEGAPVITMELIPGGTLQERIKADGPMPITAAVDAILQIAAGLEAAHAVGILHRDVKPSNCFIDPSGVVKIGDFGLSISTASRGDSALTLAGSVLGTPEFSSPEQLRGEALDLRTDIYSVGVTLYYLLTGHTPFQAQNLVQLLATVLEKPAPSPRGLRPEIPEELSRIVLRCLAKQAGDRFKNYDELRRALLPFNSTAPAPATLGLRFVAGVIDHFAVSALNLCVPLLLSGSLLIMADPAAFRSPVSIAISVTIVLLNLIYFGVFEGLWGASLGKALMGLRVGGLDRAAPGLPRATLRAALYLLPSLLGLLRIPIGSGSVKLNAWTISLGILLLAYPALLVLSARRRNGFATVIDLLTKTRVIQKSAYEPRATVAQTEPPVAAADTLPRLGPYHVLATLAATPDAELVLGYDTKLLRRVWIRKMPAGAPAVDVALRNAARPGRLRWLQGHRGEAGSWDAYEALPGTPLVNLLHTPQPWKNVRHWLLDLAVEFDTVSHAGPASGAFSLDRVWITADGRAKLLDFSAPGADQTTEPITEPAVLLNQLAVSALEGRLVSADEAPRCTIRVPVPIPARAILRDLPGLSSAPDFATLAARLRPLTQLVPTISRARRFGLIAGCIGHTLACAVFSLAGTKVFQSWQHRTPDLMPLRDALMMYDGMTYGKFPPKVNPEIGVDPAEIYISGRFGRFIRDPQFWSSPLTSAAIPPRLRSRANLIVAAHPDPTSAELENARAALAPAFDPQGNLNAPAIATANAFATYFPWLGAGGTFLWAAFFSLLCAPLFRGGLLMRAFGIAVVRPDGADASRGRLLWRACLAWSWLPLGAIAFALLVPLLNWPASTAIVVFLILGAIAWSAVRTNRSLHDHLAGTHLVPR